MYLDKPVDQNFSHRGIDIGLTNHVARIRLEDALCVEAVLVDVVGMFSHVLRVKEFLPVELVDPGLEYPALLHFVVESSEFDSVGRD
jgi:hypothetical protein